MHRDSAHDRRPDRVEPVLEGDGQAEIPTPAPNPPKKIRVFVLARRDDPAVGHHDLS